MNTIGKRIRYARKLNNLSITDIKDKTGISTGNLSELENDKFFPSSNTLVALRKVLHISIDWLLTGEPPMKLSMHKEFTSQHLSEEERELIDAYQKLDEEERRDIKGFIQVVTKANESLEEKPE